MLFIFQESNTIPNHRQNRPKTYRWRNFLIICGVGYMILQALGPISFISNLFAKLTNFSFCDQAPFQIRFKHHCTGQCLDCVLSRTVRAQPLPGEAASFSRNPETDTPSKAYRFHIKSLCKSKEFLIL